MAGGPRRVTVKIGNRSFRKRKSHLSRVCVSSQSQHCFSHRPPSPLQNWTHRRGVDSLCNLLVQSLLISALKTRKKVLITTTNTAPPAPLAPVPGAATDAWTSSLSASLNTLARQFATARPDATVLLFSSARTLDRILDDPDIFDLPPGDVREPFSSIWTDQLHPTSAVHDVFAMDIAEFLNGVSASQ